MISNWPCSEDANIPPDVHEVGIHAPGRFRSHGNRDSMFLQSERQSWYFMSLFPFKDPTQHSLKLWARKNQWDVFQGLVLKACCVIKIHLLLQTESAVKTTKKHLSRKVNFTPVIPWFKSEFSQVDARQWRCSKQHERHLAVKTSTPILLNFHFLPLGFKRNLQFWYRQQRLKVRWLIFFLCNRGLLFGWNELRLAELVKTEIQWIFWKVIKLRLQQTLDY